jgi:hypothetical protein
MKFIVKKILFLALILNLLIFLIFIVVDVVSFGFLKRKKSYLHNNIVYAQPEKSSNKGNNEDQNNPKDNSLEKSQLKRLYSWIENGITKNVSTIYNKFSGIKPSENLPKTIELELIDVEETEEQISELIQEDETLKDDVIKEKESLDQVRNNVLQLINSNSKLKEILEYDETFHKVEKQYKELEIKLKENKFQEAADLLKFSQTWWESLKSWVFFTDKENLKSLEDVYRLLFKKIQDTKKSKDDVIKEKESLDQVRNNVLQLINSNSKLKEILDCDETFHKVEKQYKELEIKLKENKFQEVADLFNPSQTWWVSLKNYFPLIKNTNSVPLKDIYTSILVNLQYTQELQIDFNKLQNINDEKEHTNWKKYIIQRINKFWPSAHADDALAPSNLVYQEEIPIIRNFLHKHPFATKCLGWCLGEKSNDISSIASNLTSKLAEFVGNKAKQEVQEQAEKAQKNVSDKATNAVQKRIFEVITNAVAFTSLIIAIIYWFIIKKITLKKTIK